MPIRLYRKDPRTQAKKDADARVLKRFERGEILQVDPSVERAALRSLERKNRDRKDLVAKLGLEIGRFRRLHGVSQAQVARAIGTQKTNISRAESGRHGGLTIERFVAMLEAIRSLSGRSGVDPLVPIARPLTWPPSVDDESLRRFRSPASCLERSKL